MPIWGKAIDSQKQLCWRSRTVIVERKTHLSYFLPFIFRIKEFIQLQEQNLFQHLQQKSIMTCQMFLQRLLELHLSSIPELLWELFLFQYQEQQKSHQASDDVLCRIKNIFGNTQILRNTCISIFLQTGSFLCYLARKYKSFCISNIFCRLDLTTNALSFVTRL